MDKEAGRPCPNLGADFRCGIHDSLRQRGFPGCTAYDCFGAGQRVSQLTFGGRDWRAEASLARPMFEAFGVMRHLHELLWYLSEALRLPAARPVHAAIGRAFEETQRLARSSPDGLAALDVATVRREVNELLVGASELVRADRPGPDQRGADLIGADLRRADLRGANLRGAYLIGADLRGVDLTAADLTGADLRGADLRGAALRGSVFLLQSQIDAAGGSATTTLPDSLTRPSHWSRH